MQPEHLAAALQSFITWAVHSINFCSSNAILLCLMMYCHRLTATNFYTVGLIVNELPLAYRFDPDVMFPVRTS